MSSEHHIMPYRKLFFVYIGLLIFTAITIAVSRIHLGALNIWVAILIASMKSSLVLLYFMAMKYESKFVKYTFLLTMLIVAILLGFLFWDYGFRG